MFRFQVLVKVFILLVLEFAIRCKGSERPDQQKTCYKVDHNTFCFFRPELENRRVTWQEARETCLRNNATLPSIPNEAAQEAFEKYMYDPKLVDRDDYWMAGQEVRELEWKWFNGKTDSLSTSQLEGNMGDDYVQGVITNGMLYRSDIPRSRNHFVCRFYGATCRLNGSIALTRGCLFITSTKAVNFYDARNWCVKDGGDLPVLDNRDDFSKFREIISRIPNVVRVWIGLRRQWWTWNATDTAVEMKYSNWLSSHGFKRNQTCMIVEMKEFKWQQTSCWNSKLFVCQTVVVTALPFEENELNLLSNPVPGIVLAVLLCVSIPIVAIIIIVTVVIVRRQRKAKQRQNDAARMPSDRSYQDLHERQENQYAELQRNTDQQNDLHISPDYQDISDYDDVIATRIPNYLDTIE